MMIFHHFTKLSTIDPSAGPVFGGPIGSIRKQATVTTGQNIAAFESGIAACDWHQVSSNVTRKLPKSIVWNRVIPKKSPTGPTERTPKPEYLISLATYLGVRW